MTKHVMTLARIHEGTETWTCPTCGRTLLIEWEPWRRVVVKPGDENATHSGGKGMTMGVRVIPT